MNSIKYLQAGFFVLCFLLFMVQLVNFLIQYKTEVTTMAISYTSHKTLPLPSITLCPKVPFRVEPHEVFLHEEDYLKASFSQEDLLVIIDRDNWDVHESRLSLQGRCFTLEYRHKVISASFAAGIGLAPNTSFNLAFHSKSQEFWLYDGLTPMSIKWESFDSEQGEIIGADVHIEKKVSIVLSRSDAPCNRYEDEEQHTNCLREVIYAFVQTNLTCWEPSSKFYFKELTAIPPCQNLEDLNLMREAFTMFMHDLARRPHQQGCPFDCTSTTYIVNMNTYNRKSEAFVSKKNTSAGIYFIYDKSTVETQQEILVYDVPKLLAAIGGSMGLFLGLSLYTTMTEVLTYSRRHCFNSKNRRRKRRSNQR